MDCEKYDKIALDLLYEELDELTSASARRHLDQCARCRDLFAKLRATREVGQLPLVDPPDGFEQRVLEAERQAHGEVTFGQRIGRAVSILAGYAMRPQLAMAALLLLMIGSSLLFLRARPGQRGQVLVTERGVPEARDDGVALPPPPGAAAPEPLAVAPEESSPPAAAAARPGEPQPLAQLEEKGAARSKKAKGAGLDSALPSDEMAKELGALGAARSKSSSPDDATQALQKAREVLQASGCTAAADEFDRVAARFPGSDSGNEALWRSAECRRRLGDSARARQSYETLLNVTQYQDRAAQALKELGEPDRKLSIRSKKAAKPAAKPAAPAKNQKESKPSPPPIK